MSEVVQPNYRDADCECQALDQDPDTVGTHFYSCPQRVRQGGHRAPADAVRLSPENWQLVEQALQDAQITVADTLGRRIAGAD